jgi:hypothetical protein
MQANHCVAPESRGPLGHWLRRLDQFGIPIFQVNGDIGLHESVQIMSALQAAIDQGHREIGLDLLGVVNLQLPGETLVKEVTQWLAQRSRRLRILGASREVLKFLSKAARR